MSQNSLKYNTSFNKLLNSNSNINAYPDQSQKQIESAPYSNNYLKDKPFIQSFSESSKKIPQQCNSPDGAVKIMNSDQNNLSISDLSANKYSLNFKPTLFSPDITTDDIDGKRTGNFTTADHTPRNTFILEQKDIDGYSTNPREYQQLSENIKLVLNEKLMEYPQKKRGLLEQQRALLQKEREILEREQQLVDQEEEIYRSSYSSSQWNQGQYDKIDSPDRPNNANKNLVSPSSGMSDFPQFASPMISDIRIVKGNFKNIYSKNRINNNNNVALSFQDSENDNNNNDKLTYSLSNQSSNKKGYQSQNNSSNGKNSDYIIQRQPKNSKMLISDFASTSAEKHKSSDFSMTMNPYEEQTKQQDKMMNISRNLLDQQESNIQPFKRKCQEDSRQFSPPMKHKTSNASLISQESNQSHKIFQQIQGSNSQTSLQYSITQGGSTKIKKPQAESQSPIESYISSGSIPKNELFLEAQERESILRAQKHELGIQVSESNFSNERGIKKSFRASPLMREFPKPRPTRMDQQSNIMMSRSVSPVSGNQNNYGNYYSNNNNNQLLSNTAGISQFSSPESTAVVAYPLSLQPQSVMNYQAGRNKNLPVESKEVFGSRKSSVLLNQTQPQQEEILPIKDGYPPGIKESNQQQYLSRHPSGISLHSIKPIYQDNQNGLSRIPSNSFYPSNNNVVAEQPNHNKPSFMYDEHEIELIAQNNASQPRTSSFMIPFSCLECLNEPDNRGKERVSFDRPPAQGELINYNQQQPSRTNPLQSQTGIPQSSTNAPAPSASIISNNRNSLSRSPSMFGDSGSVKVSQISMISNEKFCEKCMEFITADRFTIHTQVCSEQIQLSYQPTSLKQLELINQKLLKLAYFIKRKSSMETPLKEINQQSEIHLNLHPKLLIYCKYLHECLCSLSRDSLKLSQVSQGREDLGLIASRIQGIQDSRGFDVFAQKAMDIVNIKEQLLSSMLE